MTKALNQNRIVENMEVVYHSGQRQKKLLNEPTKMQMKSIHYLGQKSKCDTEAAKSFAELLKNAMRTKPDETDLET